MEPIEPSNHKAYEPLWKWPGAMLKTAAINFKLKLTGIEIGNDGI